MENYENQEEKNQFEEAVSKLFYKKGVKDCNFTKKWFQYRCVPVNFAKFLRTPILYNICERLVADLPEWMVASSFLNSIFLM